MTAGTVTVHLVPPDLTRRESDDRCLSVEEKQRAESFRFRYDAARWVSYRAALRRILGAALRVTPQEVPLLLTEFGKPVIAPPFAFLHFSLSHCDDMALVAWCVDGPVGVDVEPISRATSLLGCESTFCHSEEMAALPAGQSVRGLQLLELWTAKEALLKALGTGFSHPPERVRIRCEESNLSATSDAPLPGLDGQALHRLRHPALAAHCAALSAPASIHRIEIIPPQGWTSEPHSAMPSSHPRKTHG